MYTNTNDNDNTNDNTNDNKDDDDANALIDSYFLPGGILDPEDSNNNTKHEDDETRMNQIQTHGQSRIHMDHSDTMGRSLDVHNTESLRSRLDQLALGGQSLQYNVNVGLNQPRSRTLPIGTFSAQAQDAPRVGVSGLDPTADDIVGGRPILMGATLPTSSTHGSFHGNQIPSPNIVVQNGLPLRDYNADWFVGRNTTSTQENELSNILRGALQGSNTVPAPLLSPTNPTQNQPLKPQDAHPTHTSFSSNSNDESRATSATSHVQRNPWSNEHMSKLKMPSAQLTYGGTFPESSVSMEAMASSSSNERHNFQPEQPLSHNSIIPATQQPIRPPPGFHSSSPQLAPSLGQTENRNHDPSSTVRERIQLSPKQMPIASISRTNPSPFQQQSLVRDDLQPSNADAQQLQKNKIVHHNDGDYDVSSVNTKSSRDIPSTIYVEEDTASTSEDTLTVCADSVTEASTPRSSSKLESERNCMDVVEESSGTEQKRNKSKRNKKKRSKKKHNVQESLKSQGASTVGTLQDEVATMKFQNAKHKVDSDEESKESRKLEKESRKARETKKSISSSSASIAQAASKSSAGITALSSTTTAIQRVATKKNFQNKFGNDKPQKNRSDMKPREPLTDVLSKWCSNFLPSTISAAELLFQFSMISAKGVMKTCVSWFPKKERFWFLLPFCCITVDFFFLSCAMICKAVGQIIYVLLMAHKLAIIELMESEYAAICYSVIFFYPEIVKAAKVSITYQDYWPVFVRWVAIDRWFCRPITMKETYLYRLRSEDKEGNTSEIVKRSIISGNHMFRSLKAAVDLIVRKAKEDEPEESERATMANHILIILRKVTPLILMLEVNIQQEGFLVLMTSTERVLFGYGFAVLRSGYLFSPLIWISWTIQLTIIMFVQPNAAWSYFIFIMGLVSIRLSHYSAAVEDLEGIQGLNSHATSRRRGKAGFI